MDRSRESKAHTLTQKMAAAAASHKLNPLYQTDFAHVTALGAPLAEAAPSEKELQRVADVIQICREALQHHPNELYINEKEFKSVTDMWVFRYEECCTETRGDAVADILWAARAYFLCGNSLSTRTMAELADIHELYVRVLLLGTNHTRRRFEEIDSDTEVELLERRCACLLVYCLGDDLDKTLSYFDEGGLPPLSAVTQAAMEPLRNVPDIAPAAKSAEGGEEKKQQPDAEPEPKEEFDANEGDYWHTDRSTVVRGFARMCSRVFRTYWLERKIFEKFPVRDKVKQPNYSDVKKAQLHSWLQQMAKRNYSDSSDKLYRDFIYEHWMPDGSRQEVLRSFSGKYDWLQALNLLEQQLGVDSATSLANIARTKGVIVAADPAHEVYDFFVFSQYAYFMKHKAETDLLTDYYIWPAQLGQKWKRLTCKQSWGRPRRPIFLRLRGQFWIHDAGEWIPTSGAVDLLLKLMTLWVANYGSALANGKLLGEWIRLVTEPPSNDD